MTAPLTGDDLWMRQMKRTAERMTELAIISAPTEVPIPEREIGMAVRLPAGRAVSAVRQRSPDRDADESLPFEQHEGFVRFVVPELLCRSSDESVVR